ncbi:hypothetical protein ACFQU2_38520 [Siccirubricoccus deserti]
MWYPARQLAILLALAASPATAQPTAEIGSWRLTCATDRMTDRASCTMRHRDWVEPLPAPRRGWRWRWWTAAAGWYRW